MSARPALSLLTPDPEAQAIADYLAGRPRNTQAAYRQDIACFRAHRPGSLGGATAADIQGWVGSMSASGFAAETIRRRWSTLRGLLKALGALPEGAIRLPRIADNIARRILTRPQVSRLFAAAETPQAALAIRLLYYTGLRVGELCALRWVDLSEEDGKGWAVVCGKGTKTRAVGIPRRLWGELCKWQRQAVSHQVFDLDRFEVYRLVRVAAHRAGLRDAAGEYLPVSPHWMRHCHITHARQAGCDWDELATQAGHSDPKITRQVYAHLRREKTSADYLEDDDAILGV